MIKKIKLGIAALLLFAVGGYAGVNIVDADIVASGGVLEITKASGEKYKKTETIAQVITPSFTENRDFLSVTLTFDSSTFDSIGEISVAFLDNDGKTNYGIIDPSTSSVPVSKSTIEEYTETFLKDLLAEPFSSIK